MSDVPIVHETTVNLVQLSSEAWANPTHVAGVGRRHLSSGPEPRDWTEVYLDGGHVIRTSKPIAEVVAILNWEEA